MDSGDFGSLGLWIFIASTIVASSWSKSRREAEKHETLRRIVEKTGVIDEAKLKELFSPANDEKSNPGGGYRALRITGTIIMFIGAALAIFFGTAGLFCFFGVIPPPPRGEMVAAMLSIPVGIMVLGLGVFFSSRFAEPPPDFRNQPPAG